MEFAFNRPCVIQLCDISIYTGSVASKGDEYPVYALVGVWHPLHLPFTALNDVAYMHIDNQQLVRRRQCAKDNVFDYKR